MLIKKVQRLASKNTGEIKIILVSKSVWDNVHIPLVDGLKDNGKAKVINKYMIDFPDGGKQKEYIRKSQEVLKPYFE